MRIGDALTIEVERDLLGVGVDRRDVEPHRRLIAAAAEEQVADLRCSLELRQIGRRDRRRDAGHRLRLPGGARGIDEGLQVVVEELVEQSAGREQLGEVVQRDVIGRAGRERVAAGDGLAAQRAGPPGAPNALLRLIERAAAAQLVAADRHRLQPARHRLRIAAGLGLQQLRGIVAGRRAPRHRPLAPQPVWRAALQIVQQLQRIVDRCARPLADEVDQRGVAILDCLARRFRRRPVGRSEDTLQPVGGSAPPASPPRSPPAPRPGRHRRRRAAMAAAGSG